MRSWADPLVAVALVVALAVALLVAALAPPVPVVVSLDEPQAGVQLQGFYSPERSPRGIVRWTHPVAAIAIDASAFADYRLTLTLQNVPGAASQRPLAVFLGNEAVVSMPVGEERRQYSFLLPRPSVTRNWARTSRSIRLEAPPQMPPGDARVLGVLVAGVEATPVRSWRPALPPLLLPLVLVLAAYAALRVLRLRPLAAAAILLLPIAWYGTVAARSPLDALQLAHLPLAYPWYTAGGLGLLAAVGVLASLGRRQVIRALPLLPVLVPAAQIALLSRAIWTQSAAVPFWDEWETVDLLYKAEQGTLGWRDFWAFHNEHRLVLPRLISLGLIELTHWSRPWAMMFDLGLATAAGGVLLWCVRRTLGSWRWSLVLAPLLGLSFFSFTQYENWLWPFQITFFLTVAGASACMWALAREPVTKAGFGLALLGAVASSLSSLAGLMVWPAFFPVAARLGRRYALLWIGAALLVGIPYFAGFPSRASTDTRLLDIVRYGLAYLGSPPGAYNASTAQLFAAGSLLVIALNLFAAWRVGVDLRPVVPWTGLGLFALACAGITALGRGPALGVRQALSSRYHAFAGLWWVVVLVSTAFVTLRLLKTSGAAGPGWEIALRRLTLSVNVLAVSLICLGLVQANRTGYSDLHHWQSQQRQYQACVRDYLDASDSCLSLFYPVPALLRIRAAFLDTQNMAIFRERPRSPVVQLHPNDGETQLALERISGVELQGAQAGPVAIRHGSAIVVEGWAVDSAARSLAAGVFVTVDEHLNFPAEYGLEHTGAAEIGTDATYRRSGFRATIPSSRLIPGKRAITLKVLARDGRSYYRSDRLAIVEVGGVTLAPEVAVPVERSMGELTAGVEFTQSFRSRCPYLSQVEVLVSTYGRPNEVPVVFRLVDLANGRTVREGTASPGSLYDNTWHTWSFEGLGESGDRQYQVVIASPAGVPGNTITVQRSDHDAYPGGEALVNGQEVSGDIVFRYGCSE